MSFLKRGPEIKLSDLKVPGFVEDIYLDLKERHLLPVAAILLVAIVVVPFAVAQSSGSPEPGGAEGEASVSSEAGSSSGNLVAQATPGLRKYQRRLDHLQAKDPFKQRYTAEGARSSGGGSGGGSESAGGSSSETSTGGSAEPTESYGGGGEGGGSTEYETEAHSTHSKLTYYSYAIDVRVTTGAARSEQKGAEGEEGGARQSSAEGAQSSARGGGGERRTTVRRKLPELTMLPSRKTPAVIYMGSTRDAKKALLVVSSNVTSIFGDAKCVLGSQTCEMIALEPGLPETFVYGGNGRTFKLELLKIRLVETSKLNRAPLGKPKQGEGQGKRGGKSSG